MTDFIQMSREAAAQGDQFAAYRLAVAAVEANENDAEGWHSLGMALHAFKKYPAAVAACQRAARLRPEHHESLVNLGINLGLMGRFEEAVGVLERGVAAAPDRAIGYLQLSIVLHAMGNPESTERARVAVSLDPESDLAHTQLALCLMADGNWEEGWREYEWRLRYKLTEFLSYPYPLWRGEQTGTLLIVAEQGLGDGIMMMRYVPAATVRADRVIWMCRPEQRRLFEGFAARYTEIVPMPAALPAADAFIPMMSLPVALGEGRALEAPYVYVDQAIKSHSEFHVGLVWAGSPEHNNAQHRDASLEAMLPLTEIEGAKFYALQLGAARSQIDGVGAHGLILDMSPRMIDLQATAEVIADLDLVITVDTAVAHLAGAMGVETWMLVNERARDWRWGRDGRDTAWYPLMHIVSRLRQEETWGPVIHEVFRALRKKAQA